MKDFNFRKFNLIVNAQGNALGAFAAVKPPRAMPWAMYLLPFLGVPLLLKHNLFEFAKGESSPPGPGMSHSMLPEIPFSGLLVWLHPLYHKIRRKRLLFGSFVYQNILFISFF